MSSPTVSVIIPVYNHAHRVKFAINSVLSQTYSDFELLVVNDGSTDNLEEVIREYTTIRLISHKTNQGRAAARNTGILAAKGKYIAFLDADDEWLPRKLEAQTKFLEHNTDISICLTGFQLITSYGLTKNIMVPVTTSWNRYLLKHIGLPDGTIPMVTLKCLQEVGLQDTTFFWHENWEWLFRASLTHNIGAVDKILAIKKRGQKRPPAHLKDDATQKFINKYISVFENYGIYGRSAIALRWFDLAISYFHEKNHPLGFLYLKKSVCMWPLQTPGLYFRLLDAVLGTTFENNIQQLQHFFTMTKKLSTSNKKIFTSKYRQTK